MNLKPFPHQNQAIADTWPPFPTKLERAAFPKMNLKSWFPRYVWPLLFVSFHCPYQKIFFNSPVPSSSDSLFRRNLVAENHAQGRLRLSCSCSSSSSLLCSHHLHTAYHVAIHLPLTLSLSILCWFFIFSYPLFVHSSSSSARSHYPKIMVVDMQEKEKLNREIDSGNKGAAINLDDFDTNCGNYRKEQFHNVVHHVEGELQLKLGMIVHDECEAYNLYNEYALQKGFSIRRDQKRYKSGTKEIRERTFVCSKQGFQDCNPLEVKAYDRLTTRTGCVAHVTFKIENGIWEIIKLNDEHNHEFSLPGQRHLLRSGRKMSHVTKDVVKSLHSAGVGPTKAHAFVAQEVGGYENVEGTKRDFQNFLHRTKLNLIGAGDAQALINHFKIKQASDPMFFYSVQLDNENRLTNIFWRDGISKLDYEGFGDVVIFDTTFRTNKYNLVCAPFVGVNHHWQNTLFGCAFLVDESTISFVWLFETFLLAMDNKQPKTIFTDQDHAIASAIKIVFTNASHRLCQWHIHKNAAQRIPHLYGKAEFKKKFYKCFVGCQTEEEFESTWKEMVEEWSATENSWLRKLYEIREKWCPVFSNDCFSAGMKSSQRSESTNNIFHEMSCKTMSLMEFALHYNQNSEKMRAHAKEEDFRSAQGKLRVYIPSGILMHAADIYTYKVFRMFQEEFFQSVTQKVIDHVHDGLVDCYRLKKEDSEKVHTVWFNTSTFTITCSCKKFESLGLLCCHALRIFNVLTMMGGSLQSTSQKDGQKGSKK